jgi:hypothetical protein
MLCQYIGSHCIANLLGPGPEDQVFNFGINILKADVFVAGLKILCFSGKNTNFNVFIF